MKRELIGLFERYCQVLFDRCHDRVKLWILVNQIDLVSVESFNHLGICADNVENLAEAKYPGLHNEMVACARATRYAHENYPDLKIGMMLCGGADYPASPDPEDVLGCYRHNQIEYCFGGVLLRGIYPGYALRFFEDKGHDMQFGAHDLEDLCGYYAWAPIDIVSCSSSEMPKRSGFIYVDLDDEGKGTGRRIRKDSFSWYHDAIATNGGKL